MPSGFTEATPTRIGGPPLVESTKQYRERLIQTLLRQAEAIEEVSRNLAALVGLLAAVFFSWAIGLAVYAFTR